MRRPVLRDISRTGMILLLSLTTARAAAESARLVSVRPVFHPREMEVIIQVEGPFSHSFYELQGPPRLVVDLTSVKEVAAQDPVSVRAFGVDRIRIFLSPPETARIVFDLAVAKPFYLVNTLSDGIQVVFLGSVPGKRAVTAKPEPSAPLPPVETRPDVTIPEAPARPPAPASTLLGLSLANITLADERFQLIFGHRTHSLAAVDVAQVVFRTGPWSVAAAADLRRLSLEGRSTITAQTTRAAFTPLDLGVRLILQRGVLWPYLGAGLTLCPYAERSALHDTSGTAFGLSAQAGIVWGPASFKFLKARAFIRWSHVLARENSLEVDLGGLEVGAGLILGVSLF